MDRVFGRGRERITADAMGKKMLATAIASSFQSEGCLHALVEGFDVRIDQSQFRYEVESVLFSLFPFDLVATKSLGVATPAVRDSMRAALQELVVEIGQSKGESINPSLWNGAVEERFQQYAEILRGNTDKDSRYAVLGLRAARNISGGEDIYLEFAAACSVHFVSLLNAVSGMVAEYEIIG